MTPIESQILESWRIHNRINLLMIDHISEEAMRATLSKRGGRDISRQWAHMYNVRCNRLAAFSKKQGKALVEFDKNASPDKDRLREAFVKSGEMMEQYLAFGIENEGAVSNFKRGVVPMLAYYITHESHHRGNILLTMKQTGHKLPEALKWGIWDYNKI